MPEPTAPDIADLAARLVAGERRALARAITLVESTRPDHRLAARALLAALPAPARPSLRVGLTGTPEQIAEAAKVYRAYYQKVGEGEDYVMNHSLTVYLMGPDGKFRTAVAYGMGPDKTTRIIEQAMARG